MLSRKNERRLINGFIEKKKRGPYKQYNVFGSMKKIPAKTLFNWHRKIDTIKSKNTLNSKELMDNNSLDDLIFELESVQMESNLKKKLEDVQNLSVMNTLNDQEYETNINLTLDTNDFKNQEKVIMNEVERNVSEVINEPDPEQIETKILHKKNLTENLIRISKNQLIDYLLVMAIKWRRGVTYTVAHDMLELVNASSVTNSTRNSKHFWKTIVKKYSSNVYTHYICDRCNNYLGSENNCPPVCSYCKTIINFKLNNSKFLYLPLSNQLQELFQTTDAHNLYSKNRTKLNKYAIEDIFDGKMYKEHNFDDNMISINFSIDGAPMFNSSNTSVYPVLCTVNELSPVDRRNNIFLSSVWFGVSKPKNMNSYLTPFVAEAKKLLIDGFTYTYQGQTYKKFVITLMGVCDSVARPLVQCIKQFNGEYGCNLCLHPGEPIEKGRGKVRVYPIIKENPFGEGLRTHDQTLFHAEQKIKRDRKGVKDVSVLCEISNFNIINNLDVEWMHCVGLGVCRQFVNLWFDSNNCNKKFYFGSLLKSIDKLILKFTPISNIARTPRSLSDRSHFKAHEWIIFLLAYSLPVLKTCFPQQYVNHWALLVDGISILVNNSILKSELIYADDCLRKFVLGVESLYGKEHISFNVHLLLHLATSVENWGPLWTHSAFLYENFNQTIKGYVKSPNGVLIQICDSFRLKCAIDRLTILCESDLNYKQEKLLENLLNKKSKPISNFQINNCKVLGKSVILNKIPSNQHSALRRLNIKINKDASIFKFKRCIINGEIFTSKNYRREKKRKNNFVMLQNGSVFKIFSFFGFVTNFTEKTYLIGYYFTQKNKQLIINRRLDHLIVLDKKINMLAAVSTELVKKKIMIMKVAERNLYVAYTHYCDNESKM